MNKDVIVIGAGFTGLTAAKELEKEGKDFLVLEAENRLGGRNFSFSPKNIEMPGLEYEHGSQYIGHSQEPLWSTVTGDDFYNWMVENYPEYTKSFVPDVANSSSDCDSSLPPYIVDNYTDRLPYDEQVLILTDTRTKEPTRFPFNKNDTPYGITGLPSGIGLPSILAIGLVSLDIIFIESCINVVEPWESEFKGLYTAEDLDSISFEEWLNESPRSKYMTPTALDAIRIAVQALLSVEPSEISALYFFWYCACNEGFFNEVNDSINGPQQYWLRCGFGKVLEFCSESFKEQIQFERTVKSVSVDESSEYPICLKVNEHDVYYAKQLIVAVSPHTANKIEWPSDLPEYYQALMKQGMGRTLKAQVFYDKSWWNNIDNTGWQGYSGGTSYPVLWTMDNSAYDGNGIYHSCLMTFTIGDQINELEKALANAESDPQEGLKSFLTKHISYLFTGRYDYEPALKPVAIESSLWAKKTNIDGYQVGTFIGGGPNTVFAPNFITSMYDGKPALSYINQPWKNLIYFSAAELARNLNPKTPEVCEIKQDESGSLLPTEQFSDNRCNLGYMNGAIYSGQYVVQQVIEGVDFKEPVSPEPSAEKGHWQPITLLSYALRRALDSFFSSGQTFSDITQNQQEKLLSSLLGDLDKDSTDQGSMGHMLRNRTMELYMNKDISKIDFLANLAKEQLDSFDVVHAQLKQEGVSEEMIDFLARLYGQSAS